jgi:predicted dehydrogenase
MKVALIGVGMVGGTYVKALADLSDRIAFAGLCARRPESAEAFRVKHGLDAHVYASVDEIAADPDIDFAILVTPPDARIEPVRTLARAGKPILMEKPVARSLPEAEEVVAICEAAEIPLGITFQFRCRPAVRDLRRVIEEGGLGTLRAVELNVPWWRPQSYYDEPGRGTYARDGGGVLITQAIHALDLMLSFTGPVADVMALTATTGMHRMESEDFVAGGLRFENGVVGALFATTANAPGRPESLTLNFDNATAYLAATSLKVDWLDGRSETIGTVTESGSGADPMAFKSDWHRDIIADFADALQGGRPPLVTGREALNVHRLIAALEESGRTGARAAL